MPRVAVRQKLLVEDAAIFGFLLSQPHAIPVGVQNDDLHVLTGNPAATFFLHASGESMLGVGTHDGDLLVVNRSLEAFHNRLVVAALVGELLVKRLCRKGGRVLRQSANREYPDFDITELEHVHIWGVVSYVVRRL